MSSPRQYKLNDFEQAMIEQEEQDDTIILALVIAAIGLCAWAGVAWWVWRWL